MSKDKGASDTDIDQAINILGKLFKGIGVPPQQPQQQAQTAPVKRVRYHRLIRWLKEKYGDQFKDGSTTAGVQKQLENIYGQLSMEERARKGWKAYIERRQYGDLVRVSDPIEVPAGEGTRILCPKCKKTTALGKFCENCGAPLTNQICPKCGAENSLTAKFCNSCGNKFG